jgi:hypothetical protein
MRLQEPRTPVSLAAKTGEQRCCSKNLRACAAAACSRLTRRMCTLPVCSAQAASRAHTLTASAFKGRQQTRAARGEGGEGHLGENTAR